ncbi:MAG: response regulator transcription factor [Paludibacter sp.]|nr:response regulator transcription factor [Paludibacter sp.]
MNLNLFKKPTVIIVDDHLIFQQGLKSIITAENIATVIGEASNGKDFIDILSNTKPDLVLMDIDMPQMNGLEAAQKALELMPGIKIIILTMFGDEDYYYKMIDIGVKGFILKSTGIAELEKAIHEVMRGESYFSNELLTKIIRNFSQNAYQRKKLVNDLTDRELMVLQQICQGLTTNEIAEKLNISPKTVKSHRSNLLEKTACKNTPGLILFALKNKIIEL